jgi:hypothetical protein
MRCAAKGVTSVAPAKAFFGENAARKSAPTAATTFFIAPPRYYFSAPSVKSFGCAANCLVRNKPTTDEFASAFSFAKSRFGQSSPTSQF